MPTGSVARAHRGRGSSNQVNFAPQGDSVQPRRERGSRADKQRAATSAAPRHLNNCQPCMA
eukprot:3911619-Alexandrium_andersonii.AAC.1